MSLIRQVSQKRVCASSQKNLSVTKNFNKYAILFYKREQFPFIKYYIKQCKKNSLLQITKYI